MNLQRTLSAGALALVATSVSAQSDVQLFGLVDMMLYRRQLAAQPYHSSRLDSGGLNTSYWGVRGREDLGGGLSAHFELTSFFRADTGQIGRSDTDPFYARSSWVGLQADWGGVQMGRQTTLGFTNMVRYSAFGGSSSFNPSFLQNYLASATQPLMTGSGAADSAWNNATSYTSPNVGGLSGSVYYAPSESTSAGNRTGASLNFTRGAFSAGLVNEKISGMDLNFSIPPAVVRMQESQVWNLGASYDFEVVKLFAQAIKTKLRNATTHIDLDTVNIGASVLVGSGRFLISHGETTKSQTRQADLKRQTTSVAYDYLLSKRTDLYAVMMHDALTGASNANGFAIGMRHRF